MDDKSAPRAWARGVRDGALRNVLLAVVPADLDRLFMGTFLNERYCNSTAYNTVSSLYQQRGKHSLIVSIILNLLIGIAIMEEKLIVPALDIPYHVFLRVEVFHFREDPVRRASIHPM
jgi:hypothetical protein